MISWQEDTRGSTMATFTSHYSLISHLSRSSLSPLLLALLPPFGFQLLAFFLPLLILRGLITRSADTAEKRSSYSTYFRLPSVSAVPPTFPVLLRRLILAYFVRMTFRQLYIYIAAAILALTSPLLSLISSLHVAVAMPFYRFRCRLLSQLFLHSFTSIYPFSSFAAARCARCLPQSTMLLSLLQFPHVIPRSFIRPASFLTHTHARLHLTTRACPVHRRPFPRLLNKSGTPLVSPFAITPPL